MFNLNEGLLQSVFGGAVPFVHFALLFAVLMASYLLGSINSAILISKLVYRDDIRTHGSGNAGMTNMLRTYGAKAALLTLAGDLLKTVISVFIAGFVFGFNYIAGISIQGYCYLAGLFAVIGHIFPIYYRFKGGKGVLVTSTMALMLTPIPFLILFALFVGIVALSKYVSLGSVCVAVLYPVLLQGYFSIVFDGSPMPAETAIASIALACIIVWCHRKNLERISKRTENKLSFKRRKNDQDTTAD